MFLLSTVVEDESTSRPFARCSALVGPLSASSVGAGKSFSSAGELLTYHKQCWHQRTGPIAADPALTRREVVAEPNDTN